MPDQIQNQIVTIKLSEPGGWPSLLKSNLKILQPYQCKSKKKKKKKKTTSHVAVMILNVS